MKPAPDKANFFLRQVYYPEYIKFKPANVILTICWFCLILIGTIIVGASATNYFLTFDYCQQTQNFCTRHFGLSSNMKIYFYMKLHPIAQNNRYFLDSYSAEQLNGQIGNADKCSTYYTYQSLGIGQTVGGYRVIPGTHAHPCGFPMRSLFNDSIYLIDNQGGTPVLDQGNLVSSYYTQNRFARLSDYQLSQWVDVNSTNFMNWFTVPMTNTKYMFLGKLSMAAGNYQMVFKNNFPTDSGDITKTIILTEVNGIGDANLVLGFSIFGAGIAVLFVHVFACCRQKKR